MIVEDSMNTFSYGVNILVDGIDLHAWPLSASSTGIPNLCSSTTKLKWKKSMILTTIFKLISPECCIYALVNWVSIVSDNGLSPNRRQAII